MKNIKKLIKEIIPPNNYQNREGFSNKEIIDNLSEGEKGKIESHLLKMVKGTEDWLIGETLIYLNSEKAIPVFEENLYNAKEFNDKIFWANSIFKMNQDSKMIDFVLEEVQNLEDKSDLHFFFYHLAEFKDERLNEIIRGYQDDDEYLVAYHALQSLGQDVSKAVNKSREKRNKASITKKEKPKKKNENKSKKQVTQKKKPWWKFW